MPSSYHDQLLFVPFNYTSTTVPTRHLENTGHQRISFPLFIAFKGGFSSFFLSQLYLLLRPTAWTWEWLLKSQPLFYKYSTFIIANSAEVLARLVGTDNQANLPSVPCKKETCGSTIRVIRRPSASQALFPPG